MTNFFSNPNINGIIKKNLEQKILSFGDYKYAYVIMNKKNPYDILIINNHPSWFKIYLDDFYQFIDPVILKSMDTVESFSWDEKIVILSEIRLKRIFRASHEHNISAGHTFVLHDNRNNLVVMSVFDTTHSSDFRSFISKNKEMIQYLLITTHQKMLSLYQEMEGNDHKRKILLTKRENEILHWTGMGKNYSEVAVILGISVRTVKFHMSNIVDKLSVSNARHAIKIAAELKIVRPIFSHKG